MDSENGLAISQGGSQVGAHAQDEISSFLKKGEEILGTFTSSIRAFEAKTLSFQNLEKSVSQIQKEMKKRKLEERTEPDAKRTKNVDTADDENGNQSGDDIDELLLATNNHSEHNSESEGEEEMMSDLGNFFEIEQKWGAPVGKKVAGIVNKSLRGKTDKEKIKQIMDKNMRPENIEALQVPRIDTFLWDQLKNETKSIDAGRQKMIFHVNQSLVPIIKAMDEIHANKNPDMKKISENIGDAFKIMASQVNNINQQRRESVKRELFPRFRSVCDMDQPVTAKMLFGDNLAEKIKTLDTSKNVKMTPKGSSSFVVDRPFLGKRGGERAPGFLGTQYRPQNSSYSQNQRARPQFQGYTSQTSFKKFPNQSQNFAKKWGKSQSGPYKRN